MEDPDVDRMHVDGMGTAVCYPPYFPHFLLLTQYIELPLQVYNHISVMSILYFHYYIFA